MAELEALGVSDWTEEVPTAYQEAARAAHALDGVLSEIEETGMFSLLPWQTEECAQAGSEVLRRLVQVWESIPEDQESLQASESGDGSHIGEEGTVSSGWPGLARNQGMPLWAFDSLWRPAWHWSGGAAMWRPTVAAGTRGAVIHSIFDELVGV